MTKQIKTVSKINQAGSMMIEALAMLTLISLVTPTLYKKSAERTSELQDINAATHARTMMKAVDNYTSTNYPTLLETLKDGGEIEVTMEQIANYLPYGYNTSSPVKNFGAPVISIRRQGTSDSLSAFVVFPKTGDITDLRASRIASMIGANGGYIDKDGVAKGVGGIWSLDADTVSGLCDDDCAVHGSIITVSSESINNATRTSFENTKYLQRTTPEDPNDKWRSTMLTDLYMGGVNNELGNNVSYNSIYGVDRLIVGATTADADASGADLIVKSHTSGGSSTGGGAFIDGNLTALSKRFSVAMDDLTPEMKFTDFLKVTDKKLEAGKNSSNGIAFELSSDDEKATFRVDTDINGALNSAGDTWLAQNEDTTFKVGQNGNFIAVDKDNIKMYQNGTKAAINLASGQADGESSDLTVDTDTVHLTGTTTVGTGNNAPIFLTDSAGSTVSTKDDSPIFSTQGNAFVAGTLETQSLETQEFDALNLTAGAENFSDNTRWLNVDDNGVIVRDKNAVDRMVVDAEQFKIQDANMIDRLSVTNTKSNMIGPRYNLDGSNFQGEVYIGSTNAGIQGVTDTNITTTLADGTVHIKNNAIEAQGAWDASRENINNKVYVRSSSTDVRADEFVVRDPHTDQKLLNIASNKGGKELAHDSIIEIDPNAFHVWADRSTATAESNPNKHILQVDASKALVKANNEVTHTDASVYIRRGAIELEGSREPSTTSSTERYSANQGVGYIEASRFVDNSKDSRGNILTPYITRDRDHGQQDYDRYMVNPAYTSVMHDIKLTTRGGARLSDILPDFINKGIYIVNNTYQDGTNFNNLTVSVNSAGKLVTNASEVNNAGSEWASPFMGVVPAPLCPPGHASVITLTPASFQMAQAGQMHKQSNRYAVREGDNAKAFIPGATAPEITTSEYQTKEIVIGENSSGAVTDHIYYLGLAQAPAGDKTPTPLYFQQSTWLKSKVLAYGEGSAGPCTSNSCPNFVGWATVMGFIYPTSTYSEVITALTGHNLVNDTADSVYWNIFPVKAMTMEAYATVYCYFDRANLFDSGNNSIYVDDYDQINHFRSIDSENNFGRNGAYLNRLNDPHLKYKDPW